MGFVGGARDKALQAARQKWQPHFLKGVCGSARFSCADKAFSRPLYRSGTLMRSFISGVASAWRVLH